MKWKEEEERSNESLMKEEGSESEGDRNDMIGRRKDKAGKVEEFENEERK